MPSQSVVGEAGTNTTACGQYCFISPFLWDQLLGNYYFNFLVVLFPGFFMFLIDDCMFEVEIYPVLADWLCLRKPIQDSGKAVWHVLGLESSGSLA